MMTCPFHDGDDEGRSGSGETGRGSDQTDSRSRDRDGAPDRREFMKAALAIGGAGALGTTVNLFGLSESAAAERGVPGYAERQNRQYAWDAYEFYSKKKGTVTDEADPGERGRGKPAADD